MSVAHPLGLHSGIVEVVPYRVEWPELFETEAQRIAPFLAEHGVRLRVEHTGSTAVPGLAAKPVLDILGGWEGADTRDAAITALEAAGYQYRGEQDIPGRDFFRRGTPRQYHLHLTRVGSAFWNDHLAFRDHLRANGDVADAYAALKRSLASRYPTDRERYIEGKSAFVLDTLARARSAR